MGKVKSWLWDQAEDKLDSITIKIENGEIDHDTAYKMVDDDTTIAWNILGFDTVDDVKDYLSEIVVKTEQQAELVDF